MERLRGGAHRKWWVLSVVTLVAFITNVDSTIVIVGLPRMMEGLHITMTTGLWTLTSYIITSTVLLLPAGRWSDMVGGKRIFLIGLGVFAVSTILCGLSPNGALLIGFRFIQGAGAALALATATPIIVQTFPAAELGRALGINSTAWVIGSIVGPVAGGALVSSWGWPWIFFVTVPFAIAGMIGAWVVLPDTRPGRETRNDWAGIATFSAALVSLLVGLSVAPGWGWTAPGTLALFAIAVLGLVAFIRAERAIKTPMFDLSLMLNRHFRSGLGVTVSYSIGFFATTFLLTIYLQGALHLSPLDAGLMLIPLSAPQLFMAPIGGSLADRFGPARLIVFGLFLLALGGWMLGGLGPHLALWAVVGPLLLMSAANGLTWPSLTKAVMSSAPAHRTGSASGMFYTFRNVGMSLSFTLALVAAESSVPAQVASQAFLGTGGLLLPHLRDLLVQSSDAGFRLCVGFFVVALLLSTQLLIPHRGRDDAAKRASA